MMVKIIIHSIFIYIVFRTIISFIIRKYFIPTNKIMDDFLKLDSNNEDVGINGLMNIFKFIFKHILISIDNKKYINKNLKKYKIREVISIIIFLLPFIITTIIYYLISKNN